MQDTWIRLGNFFQAVEIPDDFVHYRVTFENVEYVATIRNVFVKCLLGRVGNSEVRRLSVVIRPYFPCAEIFINNFKHAYPDVEINEIDGRYHCDPAQSNYNSFITSPYTANLTLKNQIDLNRLIELLKLCKADSLIPDIKQIFSSFITDKFSNSHFIGEYKSEDMLVNVNKRDSFELIHLLKSPEHFSVSKLKELLIHGENVNQCIRYKPIYYAIRFYPPEVLELLLCYGAKVFEAYASSDQGYVTAASLAKHTYEMGETTHYLFYPDNGFKVKYNLIRNGNASLPLPPRYKVKNIRLLQSQAQLTTGIDLYKTEDATQSVVDSLTVNLKRQPSRTENECLTAMSVDTFKYGSISDHALASSVVKELTNATFVEVIRNKLQRIVGFNVYAIVKENGKLYWHCKLSVLIPEYRKIGILPILLWRYAFALQRLYPRLPVGIFMVTIHPNSYRLLEGYIHWPRYQSSYQENEMRVLLRAIDVDDTLHYHHQLTTSYIDDEFEVREQVTPSYNLVNVFFYYYLLDQATMTSTAGKGVPTLFYISDESYKTFKAHCDKLAFPFDLHLSQLILMMSSFMSIGSALPACRPAIYSKDWLKNSQLLFWNNIVATSRQEGGVLDRNPQAKL